MENVPAAYQSLGAAGEARWAEIGLAWCARHLDSGVAYFRTPVQALAGNAGVAGLAALVGPAEVLFSSRRLALGSYLEGALRVRDLLGIDAVLPWAQRGADIMQAGRLRGEAFFRLESEESLALLMEHLPGYRLPEHQRVLQLVLFAWFGELFEFGEGRWRPDHGRAFIETDGATLFLPHALPTREEAMLALLHTTGHLAFESYERRYIEALFREVDMQHPPLDDDQRITWRPLFARYGDDLLRFQLIFDVCEDLRVDARIASTVPGYLDRMLAAAEAEPVPEGPPGAHFRFALESLVWLKAVREGNPPGATPLAPLVGAEATIIDSFRIANELYATTDLPPITLAARAAAFLPGRSPNAARAVYPRTVLDAAERGFGDVGDENLRKHEPEPPADKMAMPKAAQVDEEPDFEIPPEDTSGSGGRIGVGIPQPAHVYGTARGPGFSEKGYPYHEWDYRDGRFKRQWAWVQEKHLEERDSQEALRLMDQYALPLKQLKRAIQSQKPVRPAPERRQLDGDELDLEAVIAYVAEKRAGMSPKATVYRRREVQQRDTAVLLLADLSTSIMQPLAEGGGRIVDRIRAGVLLFAEAMHEVGDPYAIAGFASKYRDNVSYYPIKGFEDALTPDARAVIGGLSGRLATRMGAAIRHAVTQFEGVSSQRRLLLMLSDGKPADYDDGGDEKYLHEDTRMAVKEAVDAGVHPFCITLDPAGGHYLNEIFGPGHYLVLDHINSLPRKLPEAYLRLRRA